MVRKITAAQHVAQLRQQARQMSQHAWALLSLADDMALGNADSQNGDGELPPGPIAYEYEQLLAAMAERALGDSQLRRRLFPARILDGCNWDVLLILYRNRVQGRRSGPPNIAIALGIALPEVERAVTILVEEALAEWCENSQFVRITEEGAKRLRDFFVGEAPASSSGQDIAAERRCA